MKLNNCLYCLCHRDNREVKCLSVYFKKHRFVIPERQAEKYKKDIEYIKKENKGGRHIVACLGSAGYTFMDDRTLLANFAYNIGDKKFYEKIKSN